MEVSDLFSIAPGAEEEADRSEEARQSRAGTLEGGRVLAGVAATSATQWKDSSLQLVSG